MNIVRRLVGRHQQADESNTQDNALGLMHLRKLCVELCYAAQPTTAKEQEEKVYMMLPLFCKVFGASPASDMINKFSDVLQFASHVSKLFVTEIRRRASNQSTEAASCSIADYLEIQSTEESSTGWMLLSTLNLLAAGGKTVVDVMTAASVPSTLVKCLYLFFDLPPVPEQEANQQSPDSEFTPIERRVLLQKICVQLLVRLCSHVAPAEELARKDDLTLLFSAITSWCPPHNVPWRKGAAEVLVTLSRHGLSQTVVHYIHAKGCIALCLDNMQREQALSPLDIVEMFVTVFCFLKDSSEVSNVLLDDFRTCQGYLFLTDFMLRLEQMKTDESGDALRNLVLLVSSLTLCGFVELKPSTATNGAPFQQPGFTVPQPTGRGVSVRNMQAFQVLQTVFLKAQTTQLCSTILDVVSTVYNSDNANYFILESQNTISQFVEKIHTKPAEIQEKLFELIEFVVMHLNYVPCKELISVSILIKTQESIDCSIAAMKSLLLILKYSAIYKDVYREVGLLEVMVTCLHRYAALLKDPQMEPVVEDGSVYTVEVDENQQTLAFLTMDAMTILLSVNANNASVFRESGGARCIHNLVPYLQCRKQSLAIVQQLVLSSGGDDDMGTLLGMMHSAPQTALQFKTDILQALLFVLRDSHRCRTVFRKVGGFVYVMSVLVSMEGCLAQPPNAPWDTANSDSVLQLLHIVFQTLTSAMRHEPANAKFFASEVRYESLTDAIRLLGCFDTATELESPFHNNQLSDLPSNTQPFCDVFDVEKVNNETIGPDLRSACLLFRCLYDMAIDAFESKSAETSINSPAVSRHVHDAFTPKPSPPASPMRKPQTLSTTSNRSTSGLKSPVRTPVSSYSTAPSHPTIVHPGAVISMVDLLPAVHCDQDKKKEIALQMHVADVIEDLVKSERNQQVMCEAGLPQQLLRRCAVALAEEEHLLHRYLQHTLERLASQALEPKDLRDFLRLGKPLCCMAWDEKHGGIQTSCSVTSISSNSTLEVDIMNSDNNSVTKCDLASKCNCNLCKVEGDCVPLTRVKCLVSMTTPRDVRLHGASVTPSFVEFDMSAEGFGCLYLPSIAPQQPPNVTVVSVPGVVGGMENSVIGGIGSGERLFPPQSGLTYSVWLCVDRFSSPIADPHPVRLLTILRNIAASDNHFMSLSISLAAQDRTLVVSTQEGRLQPTATSPDELSSPSNSESVAKFWIPELAQEGQWNHLVVVLNRAVLKNSSVSVFLNGNLMKTQKLHYIQANPGGGTSSPTNIQSIYAFVGTPPVQHCPSRLLWRLGPAHLFEDVFTNSIVTAIHHLGPNYVGSFQAPHHQGLKVFKSDTSLSQISEERLLFGIHAHALSLLTVAKIRKVYNKVDSKAVAKQLGLSTSENATPIRILHNSCGHLNGPARTLGAILLGNIGVRTFCPKPVARTLENVGGSAALLGLIAMATDVEGLYAAVKALVCVVKNNGPALQEMERTRGYQRLAMLLKKKKHLLNSHILHLTFSLVGTVDSGRESTIIPNAVAFEDLLCDMEVWHNAPYGLQKSLFEHFCELLTESSEAEQNKILMRKLNVVQRLLFVLHDTTLSQSTIKAMANVITVLLQSSGTESHLLRFGQFLVSTLPSYSVSEKFITVESLAAVGPDSEASTPQGNNAVKDIIEEDWGGLVSARNIKLRNTLLEIFIHLLTHQKSQIVLHTADHLQRVLGFDWLLLFMQGHLHSTTVIQALRILLLLLSSPTTMQRFKDGVHGGGWLDGTEPVLHNRMGVVLGFNVGTPSGGSRQSNREINLEACHLPGFAMLQCLLPRHANIPQLYFLLMALLLGHSKHTVKDNLELDLDSIWKFIFGVPASQTGVKHSKSNIGLQSSICMDSALVILSMIRTMLNQNCQNEEDSWMIEYPVTLIQFLLFLYHNTADIVPLCMSGDFLCGLAATLFPIRPNSDQGGSVLEEFVVVSETGSELSSPADDYRLWSGSEVNVRTPIERGNSIPGILTTHPARKFVFDFLRVIVVDSLSLPQPSKGAPVLDLLLEASPERASHALVREFQTEVMMNLMDHLLAADALLGEEAALPITIGGSYSNLVQNIFYFTSRVVDKLWQGVFAKESKEVFDFISKLLAQAKRRSTGISLDQIYHCLNRTVLYQLSRPHNNVADQMALLDSLHRLTNSRNLVFGPGNYEPEFIACLCHCLFCLTDQVSLSVGSLASSATDAGSNRNTLWHVDTMADDDEDSPSYTSSGSLNNESSTSQEAQLLVRNAAKRVWDELITCKKAVIEDIFKVTLPQSITVANHGSPARQVHTVDLNIARSGMSDVAAKMWNNYIASEKRNLARDITQQNQSKLAKVSSGLQRLTSRAGRSRKDLSNIKHSLSSVQEANMWMFTHITVVKDFVELIYKQYQQSQQHMQRYIYDEWRQTETELTRERGLWGPPKGSRLDKWMLDMTEGPCRMRKKLERNDMFYIHYPHKMDQDSNGKPSKYRVAISFDSKEYYKRLRKQKSQNIVDADVTDLPATDNEPQQDMDVAEEDANKMDPNSTGLRPFTLLSRQGSYKSVSEKLDDEDFDPSVATDTESDGDKADNQAVLRLLEEGEKIRHMFRCARIQGLDTSEGLLLFCKEHFYIIDGFTLLSTKEICDIDLLPPGHQDPIIPRATLTKRTTQKRLNSKFAYEDIREVHKRRYLLQPIALEVFSSDGRNFLLAFPKRIRNKVNARFIAEATGLTDSASQSVAGQKRNAQVEVGSGLFSSLMGEKSVTQRWERGEISNFQYLMFLNTLAGRSYNDLMQYQVFPWILADYDSEELDLTDSRTFRDLSKPMGAQTEERLKQFNKRFNDWEDPNGETPPYHYGTHYSSAMIVASYLVRMESFTQHFLSLQGGHFDLADRMFHSIKEAWLSASKHNMADVKELIPEFFYLPEFLTNSNNYDLGAKQSGVCLGDVILPPWAKGDPREFIRVHREALECDYVSANLHHWIDLIFGYKQNGPPAAEAVNVFHYLFYEGNVDIYSIEDPLKKNATIGFINNFGQIPTQLFKKAHPQRRIFNRIGDSSGNTIVCVDRLFYNNLDTLKPTSNPIKELKMSVGQIISTDKSVLAVEPNKVLVPSNYTRYIAWGYADLSLRMGGYDSEKAHTVFEGTQCGEILCAVCPNSKLLVTGGTSTVVHVWCLMLNKEKSRQLSLKQALYGHDKAVTCLAASSAYSIIVSGSRDKTCMVWDLNKLIFVRQLRDHAAPVAALAINNVTGDIVTCAGTFLYVWGINGDLIASVNTSTGRDQQILCCVVSELVEWDPSNVIATGSSDGVVRMWSIEFVQVPADPQRQVSGTEIRDMDRRNVSVTLVDCKQASVDSSISEAETKSVDTQSIDSVAMCSEQFTPGNTSLPTPTGDNQSLCSTTDGEMVSGCSSHQLDMLYLGSETKENPENVDEHEQVDVESTEEIRTMQSNTTEIDNEISSVSSVSLSEQVNNGTVNLGVGEGLRAESPISDSGSYEVISDLEINDIHQEARRFRRQDTGPRASHKHKLKPGFKWERQLIFRSKLTRHTAYERKDNAHPSSVTALAISKDHTKVYVGDDRGRIFSWTVTDQPGRSAADHWVKDESGDSCVACNTKFSFSERRHHCRNCGQLFCARCSRFEIEINRLRIMKPVRVCQACYNILKAEQAAAAMQKS